MYAPLLAQGVHQLHDVERLLMRHLARLQQSVDECLPTSEELVFVARNLLRHVDILYKLAVVGVDRDLLWVVDIVDDKVAVGTRLQSIPSASIRVMAFVRSIPVALLTHCPSMLTISAGQNIRAKFRQ